MLSDDVDHTLIEGIAEATPYYLIDLDGIAESGARMIDAWSRQFPSFKLAYSYKTNSLPAVTRTLRSVGCAAEVVSGPEMHAALEDGHAPGDIVFDGPVKYPGELADAVERGVRVQIDSLEELDSLVRIKESSGVDPVLSLRLAGLRNGAPASRFGLDRAEVRTAIRTADEGGLTISGVHFNTGQHPVDARPFQRHLQYWAQVIEDLRRRSRSGGWNQFVIDIGGGFPATSSMSGRAVPEPFSFAVAVGQQLDKLRIPRTEITMIIEPGRSLVEDHGMLVASVIALKDRDRRRIAVLDAGTNLVRSIISWEHPVRFLRDGKERYDVYGAMCFESDRFAERLGGPEDLSVGDLAVVGAAGGYDIPSANVWLRPSPPVLVLEGGFVTTSRQRGELIR